MKEKSAGIVIYRMEKSKIEFLLLHYPSGHWDFVKGKMEKNETMRETAIRETKEETGISDIILVDNFKESIKYDFLHNDETINKKVVFFLGETRTKSIHLSHEHLDCIWLDYNNAMEKITFENARNILEKSMNRLGM